MLWIQSPATYLMKQVDCFHRLVVGGLGSGGAQNNGCRSRYQSLQIKGISEIGRDCGADRTHPLGAARLSGVHFSVSCVIWRQCRQVDGAPADRAAGEGPKDAPPGRSVGRGSRITPDRRPTLSEGSCVAARCCPGGDRPSFVWESR